MKKTPKKLFGLFGLLAVAAITIFAATLPTTDTSAVGTVTDTITVTVTSSAPWVEIEGPSNDDVVTHPNQTVKFKYGSLSKVTAQLIYTDEDGTTHTIDLDEITPTEERGEGEIPINISGYGYGDFTIKLVGEGTDGSPYDDAISIKYYPVITTIEQNPDTKDVYANLDYDLESQDIDSIKIDIYDENDPSTILWTTTVPKGTTKVELPFAEENFLAGKYIINTTALDASGDDLYRPYVVGLDYTTDSTTPTDVPNTGVLTASGLNISKSDFIVTGLIILSITAISGIYFVTRKKNSRK